MVKYYTRWLLESLRLGLLVPNIYYKGLFVAFKRGFLLKEALKENIYILLSLAIDGIAYSVVCGWKGY
jgi:hypothetical protein